MATDPSQQSCHAPEAGTDGVQSGGARRRASSDEVDTIIDVTNAGQVEARLVAKVSDKKSPVAFVLSHPYGPLGGNLHNNVVMALAMFLQLQGLSTLRFNFRGIDGSVGRPTWRGWGEVDDMKAACQYMLSLPDPPSKLVIIGYSYGSVIGSAVGGQMPEVAAYAAISYPFSVTWALTLFQSGRFLSLAKADKPKLFVMGTEDNFTPIGKFEQAVRSLISPLDVVTVKHMNHFWFSRESILCGIVSDWLTKVFGVKDLKELAVKPRDIRVVSTLADARKEL